MTATWTVRDRNACGLFPKQVVFPVGPPFAILTWGTDPAASNIFPWPAPAYPSLLILGIGFLYSTDGTLSTRRARITITQPSGNGSTVLVATGTVGASTSRRYEFKTGVALDTVTTLGVHRECLPDGMVLLSSPDPLSGNGTIRVAFDNGQLGDTLGDVTITGMLLY